MVGQSWGQSDSILHYPINNAGQTEYKEVVEIILTKAEIAKKTKAWIVKTYNSPSFIIQSENEDNISLRAIIKIKVEYGNQYTFTYWYYRLSIDFKEGKVILTADPVEGKNFPKEVAYDKRNPRLRQKAIKAQNSYVVQHNEYFKTLFADFKSFMLKKDDW